MDFAELGPLMLDEGTFDWALSTSAWIRVLTSNGFDIVDCIELVRGPEGPHDLQGLRADEMGAPLAGRVDLESRVSADDAETPPCSARERGYRRSKTTPAASRSQVAGVAPSSRSWYFRTRPTGLRGRSERNST